MYSSIYKKSVEFFSEKGGRDMKTCWKKIVAVVFSASCCMMGALPVAAQSIPETAATAIQTGEEAVATVESWYAPKTRGKVYLEGFIQLSDQDGKAGVYGETLARVDADEVGLYLYLEKYNGSGYDNYKYWRTVEYNESINIKSYTVSVSKGYYYRLRGFHYVDANGIYENGSTVTEGLKIPQ